MAPGGSTLPGAERLSHWAPSPLSRELEPYLMTLPFDEPGVELLQSAIQHAKAVGVDEAELQSAREQLPVLERAAVRADRERAAALRSGQHATSAVPPGCPNASWLPPGARAAWGDLCRRPCGTVHSGRLTLRPS